jgi:alpha-beta hydrolase superfamily lysophospholipase
MATVLGEEIGHVQSYVAGDGARLHYRLVEAPPIDRRGRIIYLHGSRSHSGWYLESAEQLARRGYSVYLPDRRGSGINSGPRGHFRHRDQLVDDLRRLVEVGKESDPGLPTFVVGVCWGAKTALAYALESQEELAGLVLVCPAIKTKVDLTPGEKAQVLLGNVLAPRRQIRLPLTPEMFTANPTYLQFVREDSLSLQTATARFFFQTLLWDRYLPRQYQLTLPLLLLQAGRDPIVDEPAVRRWFDRVASRDKRYIAYPDFGHTLDFEPERQRYWDDLGGWLDETARGAVASQPGTERRVPS